MRERKRRPSLHLRHRYRRVHWLTTLTLCSRASPISHPLQVQHSMACINKLAQAYITLCIG